LDNSSFPQDNNNAATDRMTGQHFATTKQGRVLRTVFVSLEILFVIGLLVLWLILPAIRQSKSLWVLFFYSFPSQFLVAVVPHEPVFLYFSKFYAPLHVTLVAIVGVLLTEILNYNVFGFFADFKASRKFFDHKIVARLVGLFKKYPFLALWIAGLTPVPFYPLRFLVVIARYPMWKYLLAVALSRTPRFFLLALLGYTLKISNTLLVIFFVVVIVVLYFPILREFLQKKEAPEKNAGGHDSGGGRNKAAAKKEGE
jgi:membrane protein YqaA with SNARE-associated domain